MLTDAPSDARSNADVVGALARALKAHAEPFWATYADPQTLLEPLSKMYLNDQSARTRYPVLLTELGQNDEATAAVESALGAIGERQDRAAKEQRAFFEWLTERLDRQN